MTEEDHSATPPGISIHLLADHARLIPAVGELRWVEWGHAPEPEDLRRWVDVTAREAGRVDLPITWVAIDGRGCAVGAVGLAELEERRDRSPWLIGMIVSQPLRERGIGGSLVQTLKQWARDRGYREVWVATGRAADFYREQGWHLLKSSINRPEKQLSSGSRFKQMTPNRPLQLTQSAVTPFAAAFFRS